jgi:hypothetical protein
VIELVSHGLSVAAPAEASDVAASWAAAALALLLAVAAACLVTIFRGIQRAQRLRAEERARLEADWHYQPPPHVMNSSR